MDWEKYTNADGSLDILDAFCDRNKSKPLENYSRGYSIVSAITSIYPIKSKELASTIFVLAIHLSVGEE